MGRHQTHYEQAPIAHKALTKTHTTGATYAPLHETQTPTTHTYTKAPRRSTTYPSPTELPPRPKDTTHANQPTTKENTTPTETTAKRTPITKPRTQTKKPAPKKTNSLVKKLNTTLLTPSLLAALIILILGVILTGFSWGWIYAAAVALVTLGFITTYTIIYLKTQ